MMESKYIDIASKAIMTAKNHGAEMAEAYIVQSKELSIEVRNGKVETMKLAEDRGLGIRIMNKGRVGFAFSTNIDAAQVSEVAQQALANSHSTEKDEHNILPNSVESYPQLDLYDPEIKEAEIEKKIKQAIEMETFAKEYDPRVKIIESSTYQDGETQVAIVNSNGLSVATNGAYCGMYIALVAAEGEDSQTGFAMDYSLKYKDLDPQKLGALAAERAVRMLGAKSITTQKMPILLDPYVATNFLGLLAPALTGEAVQKGRSLFAGKVGQKVAASALTLIDDGTRVDGIASAPFDGEGVPASRTVLLDKGELQGYLHNTYTAAKEGLKSTGNGVRGSYKSTPEVGTTNFYIQPCHSGLEELMKDMKKGLYITEVMGMHTANPISGDFSLGAAGLLIENGKFTQPVRGIAIAGNIMDLLQSVDGVGNDLQFYGSKGAPTLRITQMTVSGS